MGNLCFPTEQVEETKQEAQDVPMEIGRPAPISLEQALGLEKRPENRATAEGDSSRRTSNNSQMSLEEVLGLDITGKTDNEEQSKAEVSAATETIEVEEVKAVEEKEEERVFEPSSTDIADTSHIKKADVLEAIEETEENSGENSGVKELKDSAE